MNFFHRFIVRPYVWNELPAGWTVYSRFIGDYRHDSFWADEPSRIIRGKLHGYEMELNISQWSERATYFLGRFYDLEIQLLMLRVLRPGDRFIDVGANIGMLSLLAARLVGPDGVVDAFEPNPRCASRIHSLIARNQISNIRVHNLALGESGGSLPLVVPKSNSGEGTLTTIAHGEFGPPENLDHFEVPVQVGDEILSSDPRPPVLIKIDVEGFEHQVLSGLRRTLDDQKPLVITEVIASHLLRAGRTPNDIFDLMGLHGYVAYAFRLHRRGLRHELALVPFDGKSPSANLLWVAKDGVACDRLQLADHQTGRQNSKGSERFPS